MRNYLAIAWLLRFILVLVFIGFDLLTIETK